MKHFTIVVTAGKDKNRILEQGFGTTRKEFIERNKQMLIDAGVLVEAAGFVFKKNFTVKTREA